MLRSRLGDAAVIKSAQLIREGHDAVIAEVFRNAPPSANPYGPKSKRHIFWQHGADQARQRAAAVLQIGA